MDWQKNFQGLAKKVEEKKQEDAREAERRVKESQEIIEKFYPRVKPVCEAFAEGAKWHFKDYHSVFKMFPNIKGHDSTKEGAGHSINVEIITLPELYHATHYIEHPCSILIINGDDPSDYHSYNFGSKEWLSAKNQRGTFSWPAIAIPLSAFTEEKLAEVLMMAFRAMEGIT